MAGARQGRALHATRKDIALPPLVKPLVGEQPESGTESIRVRGRTSSAAIASAINQMSLPKSSNSGQQSTAWVRPRTVRQLAAQANLVATKLLNGEIDPETARVYAEITKIIAQAVNAEVARARSMHQTPDLSLSNDRIG